jgi:hypothetical protein
MDMDKDGIPDDKEVDCAYFNDLPYYAWGARPQQTDIFVQVDYMDNRPTPILPDLTKPSLAALKKWENIYIQYAPNLPNHSTGPLYPIRVHIDTGSLHALEGQEHQVNTDRYNLYSHDTDRHGGTVLPYKSITYFNPDAYEYPQQNMDLRRDTIFHYKFIAHRETSHISLVGKADQNGQTSGVFLSSVDDKYFSNQTKVDALLAISAAHELGHNLSLLHGGFEDTNYKPNYYSIMNYGYGNDLIKTDITHTPADIIRLQQIHTQACSGREKYFRTVQSNLDKAYLNFSNGSGQDIVLTNIDETNQVLSDQIGPIQIDYNNNSNFETSMSCRIANLHITATLKDNNDWVMMRDGSIARKSVYLEDGYPVAPTKSIIGC